MDIFAYLKMTKTSKFCGVIAMAYIENSIDVKNVDPKNRKR